MNNCNEIWIDGTKHPHIIRLSWKERFFFIIFKIIFILMLIAVYLGFWIYVFLQFFSFIKEWIFIFQENSFIIFVTTFILVSNFGWTAFKFFKLYIKIKDSLLNFSFIRETYFKWIFNKIFKQKIDSFQENWARVQVINIKNFNDEILNLLVQIIFHFNIENFFQNIEQYKYAKLDDKINLINQKKEEICDMIVKNKKIKIVFYDRDAYWNFKTDYFYMYTISKMNLWSEIEFVDMKDVKIDNYFSKSLDFKVKKNYLFKFFTCSF